MMNYDKLYEKGRFRNPKRIKAVDIMDLSDFKKKQKMKLLDMCTRFKARPNMFVDWLLNI